MFKKTALFWNEGIPYFYFYESQTVLVLFCRWEYAPIVNWTIFANFLLFGHLWVRSYTSWSCFRHRGLHSENYSLVMTEIKADLKYDYLTWGFYGSSMLAIDWKDWNLCLTCETFKTRCSKTRGFILYEEFHEGAALVS